MDESTRKAYRAMAADEGATLADALVALANAREQVNDQHMLLHRQTVRHDKTVAVLQQFERYFGEMAEALAEP